MKILYLAPHSFYIDRGTPICVDVMLRSLSERGETVHVVVYHEGEGRDFPGVTIHRIKARRWLNGIGPGFSPKKIAADFFFFFLAWRLLRRTRPDIIHAGEESVFMAMFFKLIYRIPYIYDMDSSIAQQMVEKMPWLRPVSFVFNFFEGLAIRWSRACAPVCHALGGLAEKRGAREIEVLHDISQLVDPDRPATGFLRERLGLGEEPILMYVGNFEVYQGVDLLLAGFALARQNGCAAHLVLAGGTDTAIQHYRGMADAMGIADATHFLGRWPAKQLDELLAEADILTTPRIKGLNTPMKIFPYLHSGRPVLVTDLPTHNQLLTSREALLAPADPAGFGQAIERLSGDADLRASLGKAGRAFVEANHTYRSHCDRLNRLYDRIAAGYSAQRPSEEVGCRAEPALPSSRRKG